MIFGNRTVAVHMVRGGVGFGALALSTIAPISPWWSIGLIPIALIALKGCPICWIMGLVETITMCIHAYHDEGEIGPSHVAALGGPSSEPVLRSSVPRALISAGQ